MELLKSILYDESGILFKVESGNEDEVSEADKFYLIKAAQMANERYKKDTITKEELMMFIDMFDAFSAFQDVDWIREITVKVHSALTKGISYIED